MTQPPKPASEEPRSKGCCPGCKSDDPAKRNLVKELTGATDFWIGPCENNEFHTRKWPL